MKQKLEKGEKSDKIQRVVVCLFTSIGTTDHSSLGQQTPICQRQWHSFLRAFCGRPINRPWTSYYRSGPLRKSRVFVELLTRQDPNKDSI